MINIFFIKDSLIEDFDLICEGINLSCPDEVIQRFNITNNYSSNDTNVFLDDINSDNRTEEEVNINDNSTEEVDIELDLNELLINDTLNDSFLINETIKKPFLDEYIWLDCGCEEIPTGKNIKIWYYRLFYSPLFIFTNIVLARIFAFCFYL